MRSLDFISGMVFIALGVIFCAGGLKYNLTHLGGPGAGFFPFLFGFVLIGLSVALLVSSLTKFKKSFEIFFPQETSLRKILLAVGSLLGYIFLLPYTGFLLITFLFIVFMFRAIEPANWTSTLVAAFLTTAISFLIFEIWLGVQLPRGLWRV
jgi:putative tricarboxylic transport membrane protein